MEGWRGGFLRDFEIVWTALGFEHEILRYPSLGNGRIEFVRLRITGRMEMGNL